MLEKDIVQAILKYLKTVPECFAWKEHGGMYGTAGIPDIICCYHGLFIAFEVKTEKGKAHQAAGGDDQKDQGGKGHGFQGDKR